MVEGIKYLNLGCGNKIHKDWFNMDLLQTNENIIYANFLDGIPFENNYFDVVYHSQVLEHIPKNRAHYFICECFRVLKPGGILRIVVPDLENIVSEYLRLLRQNLTAPNELSNFCYDWILIELFDQMVRNSTGGLMSEFCKGLRPDVKKFVVERIGFMGTSLVLNSQCGDKRRKVAEILDNRVSFKYLLRKITDKSIRFYRGTMPSKRYRIGDFRLSGEVHMWMYDRFSLSRLLSDCKFDDVKILSANESQIPNWKEYELDVRNGIVFDPTSLFVEARKG